MKWEKQQRYLSQRKEYPTTSISPWVPPHRNCKSGASWLLTETTETRFSAEVTPNCGRSVGKRGGGVCRGEHISCIIYDYFSLSHRWLRPLSTPFILVELYRWFGGTSCPSLQSRIIRAERKGKGGLRPCLPLFPHCPENGSSRFIWNVLTYYTVSRSGRQYCHKAVCIIYRLRTGLPISFCNDFSNSADFGTVCQHSFCTCPPMQSFLCVFTCTRLCQAVQLWRPSPQVQTGLYTDRAETWTATDIFTSEVRATKQQQLVKKLCVCIMPRPSFLCS